MAPTQTRSWILANKPEKSVELDEKSSNATFKQKKSEIPTLKENQVLIKTLLLSNDPAQRGWIQKDQDPDRLYVPPVNEGDVMRARGIGRVIQTKSDKFKEGDLVTANTNWSQYAVLGDDSVQKINEIPGVPISVYLGIAGLTGLTAYYGLIEVVRTTNKDSVVVVSGAAGATGSVVLQLAKNVLGVKKVIGIAGGKEKCDLVKSLGADIALDYKSDTFKQDLIDATPDYVDVYYDNVGGEILDLLLTRIKKHGRVAACGAIAGYNDREKGVIKNWFEVISNRIEIRGFIVIDFINKASEIVPKLVQYVKEGKIKLEGSETIVDAIGDEGFDQIPKIWHKLYEGGNTGKLVTKLE